MTKAKKAVNRTEKPAKPADSKHIFDKETGDTFAQMQRELGLRPVENKCREEAD